MSCVWLTAGIEQKNLDSEIAEVDTIRDICMIKKILFSFSNEGFN